MRHLLEGSATKSTPPRVREGYLRNQLRLVAGRPWQAAISGRLLSLAFDWRLAAEREVSFIGQAAIRFRGVAHTAIDSPLAAGPPNFAFEYEPLISDCAHANLIVWRAPLAPIDPSLQEAPRRISQDVLRALASLLKLAESDAELKALETRRAAIDCTTGWSRKCRTVVSEMIFRYRLIRRKLNRAVHNSLR
jgi:hypothetical protein